VAVELLPPGLAQLYLNSSIDDEVETRRLCFQSSYGVRIKVMRKAQD